MPHVLVLCEYGSLNGGERSLLAVLGGLPAAGYRMIAAAPTDGPLAAAFAERGVPVVGLDLHDTQGRRFELSVCRERIRAVVEAVKPDLIHANSLSMSRLSGPVAEQLGLPSLGHLRDIIKVPAAVLADLNRHTRLAAVSQATRDWYVAAGLDRVRTHVLYNGVDLTRFRPRPPSGYLHRELGLPPEASLVASIGQIGMRKGLLTLLAAAREAVHAAGNVHFVIVGQRYSQKQEALEYERQVHAAADSGPLRGRVHFLGIRSDVERLLNEFTLLVHPARQEPLGRVLLEAAAAGLPVVATDVGGTREIFPPEAEAACLVPADDSAALAAAIGGLLKDADRRAAIGRSARLRAEQVFDANRAAEGLARHYRELIASGRVSSGQPRAERGWDTEEEGK
jgi:glycosyltransferase involved in cell wall biosynthesis